MVHQSGHETNPRQTWQAESASSLPLMPTWLGTKHKIMSLLAIFKNTHFHITIPIKGFSSFIYNKAWRHKRESVYKYKFGCICIFNFFLGFNDCPNFGSESKCRIWQSHGEFGSPRHLIAIPLSVCINRNIITVLVSNFQEKLLVYLCICSILFKPKSSTIVGGLTHQGGKIKY